MKSMNWRTAAGGVFAALVLGFSATANAATISFVAYNAATTDLDLTVDVAVIDGMASFTFANNSVGSASNSSLARIYFESGLADVGLTNGVVVGGAGTVFDAGYPGPDSPPGSNNVAWAGEAAAFGASSPPSHNGLNAGESLLITFDFSGTEQALVAALTDTSGNSRIAGHILNCIDGNSCAAQLTVQRVPVPAALPLLLSALAGLGVAGRRRASRA